MFKLQVNIPEELLAEIDKVAEQKYLNRTSTVTLLLSEGVQRCKANDSLINMADALKNLNSLVADESKDK